VTLSKLSSSYRRVSSEREMDVWYDMLDSIQSWLEVCVLHCLSACLFVSGAESVKGRVKDVDLQTNRSGALKNHLFSQDPMYPT
jgi:hypothetical protein